MKVRLVATYINRDLQYKVYTLIKDHWIITRCFNARERQMAFDYTNDLKMIDHDENLPIKFPYHVLMEV